MNPSTAVAVAFSLMAAVAAAAASERVVVKAELSERLRFAGLTEHWAESVCLWHTMFGGRCYAAEFERIV